MAEEAQQELTEHEAAIYDRQLRVWGVETQKRLSAARVLIAGLGGLAAEVAKNVVLAGVGSVTLCDDTPLADRPPSNFLIHAADAATGRTVAEACVATLQEMNPFVTVSALEGPPSAALAPEALAACDLLLLCGQPAGGVAAADAACRAAGKAFYAGDCRGVYGWAFADLAEHTFVQETKVEQEDGSSKTVCEERSERFASWQDAVGASLQGVSIKRLSKLYLLLRAAARYEQQHGRFPAAADAHALRDAWAAEAAAAGVPADALPGEQLDAYSAAPGDMPAINAVVGGVLANELIKALGGKGEPINNFFLFSLAEGSGMVERMAARLSGVVSIVFHIYPDRRAAESARTELGGSHSSGGTMGKMPIRLKEVVYTLSPFEQSVMNGLWKDLPHKAAHHMHNLRDAVIFCVAPVVGIGYYCADYKEKEKQHHRY
ncbi:SUMO-activating enzyme subunit 1B-1 [Micractinium conductrix]|uniref:Ubiquitin-like 1-activating enzyme E1A n=1 Tax=Micractinium conductrix TaxID=554055 RepID=A0A2P6VDN9_9CHLO|nr:SUMO-activating enzyme subunit 1B-1 [Micractinium conductrix]|eukprot:PSC72192.1 SUMO-activating enzyme subunit 1B-1 [Micractinium conductrix]